MPTSRLSTRGQLVVPQEIREFLDLHPGDRIDFVVRESGDVVIRPAVLEVTELRGRLRREGRPPVTVEEMDHAVRKRSAPGAARPAAETSGS